MERKEFILEDGSLYFGQCIKGSDIKHGEGIRIRSDGRVYVGYWKMN